MCVCVCAVVTEARYTLTAAGDTIMAIDEEPCHSLPTQEVAARLRGPVASRVVVTMSLSLHCLSVPRLHYRPLIPACTQQPSRRSLSGVDPETFNLTFT